MRYTYDARNRLTSVTNVSSGVTTTYTYADNGDRIGQTTGSATTNYLVDDNNPTGYSQVVETWTGGGTPAITYEIGSAVISQTVSGTGAGSGTQYLMVDGHGSTRQLTSYTSSNTTNGVAVARYDYDGFGNSITIVAVPANVANTVVLYVGQMWDPGLMMYDLRARPFRPAIGRFTSYDPTNIAAGDVIDFNKYLYAGANPVNAWDPSGHDIEELVTVGIQATLFTLNAYSLGANTIGAVRAGYNSIKAFENGDELVGLAYAMSAVLHVGLAGLAAVGLFSPVPPPPPSGAIFAFAGDDGPAAAAWISNVVAVNPALGGWAISELLPALAGAAAGTLGNIVYSTTGTGGGGSGGSGGGGGQNSGSGFQKVTVSQSDAQAMADAWKQGQATRPIVGRSGVVVGEITADGNRVIRYPHTDSGTPLPHWNLEDKAANVNLHVIIK